MILKKKNSKEETITPLSLKDIPTSILEELIKKINSNLSLSLKLLLKNLEENLVSQSTNYLIKAITSGKIYYSKNNVFVGDFNSTLVRELNSLGVLYNSKLGGYFIEYSRLPKEIREAIKTSYKKNDILYSQMIDQIDEEIQSYNIPHINDKKFFKENFKKTGDFITDNLYKTLIIPFFINMIKSDAKKNDEKITQLYIKEQLDKLEQKKFIKEQTLFSQSLQGEYANNILVKIKNTKSDSLLKLRGMLSEAIQEGKQISNLSDIIKTELNVNKTRAEGLAKEEVKFFLAKYQNEKFKNLNQNYFDWVHTDPSGIRTEPRKGHVMLFERSKRGEIFDLRHPPKDPITGKPTLPQEERHCHCVAKIILDEKRINDFLKKNFTF